LIKNQISIKIIVHTRACFDEQKTAYWILLDILVADGGAEDMTPLPGNPVEEFKSCG
jgi:hypothetical protein